MRIIGTTVTLMIITHTTLHNNEARQDAPVMLSASGFHFARERPTNGPSNAKFARDNVKAFNT